MVVETSVEKMTRLQNKEVQGTRGRGITSGSPRLVATHSSWHWLFHGIQKDKQTPDLAGPTHATPPPPPSSHILNQPSAHAVHATPPMGLWGHNRRASVTGSDRGREGCGGALEGCYKLRTLNNAQCAASHTAHCVLFIVRMLHTALHTECIGHSAQYTLHTAPSYALDMTSSAHSTCDRRLAGDGSVQAHVSGI